MTSKSNNVQPVRLAMCRNSFSRSELKEKYLNKVSDQEDFNAVKRTPYTPRAAVFIFK